MMFGIGFFELCIIVGVALVCVGPQRLPELMRQMGKFFVQVRRMSSDVKSTVEQVIQDAEADLRREEHQKLESTISRQMNQHAGTAPQVKATADSGHAQQLPPDSAPHQLPNFAAATPPDLAAAASVAPQSDPPRQNSSEQGLTSPASQAAAAGPDSDRPSAFDHLDQLASSDEDEQAPKSTPST